MASKYLRGIQFGGGINSLPKVLNLSVWDVVLINDFNPKTLNSLLINLVRGCVGSV